MVLGGVLLAAALGATAPPWSGFAAHAEKSRAEWNVPGVAIGAVDDGTIVLLDGFGVRELGRDERVDADTLFPVASLSKSFTSAVVAALVTERGEDGVVEAAGALEIVRTQADVCEHSADLAAACDGPDAVGQGYHTAGSPMRWALLM